MKSKYFSIYKKRDFMIDFKPFEEIEREEYEKYLFAETQQCCELSYANLRMWGKHKAAIVSDQMLVFSEYGQKRLYHFPLGKGDKSEAVSAILQDASERKIPCCINSITTDNALLLKELFPDTFEICFNRSSFDYVYETERLAELKGRKYHRKRNHYTKFCKNLPDFSVEPVSAENLDRTMAFVEQWYADRMQESPEKEYRSEQDAIQKCFASYEQFGMEGLILCHNGSILAFTMGSRLSPDTFDVHFEKARWDVEGAYTVINCEFARYIRAKHPDVLYLNREEDMGLEGLRKAKESYFPHHMVEKASAVFRGVQDV